MDKAVQRDLMGTPKNAFTGELRLHMDGRGRLVAEAHRGLLEWSEERVRLRGREMQLLIEGGGLVLESLTAEDLVVVGRIDGLRFQPI